MRILLRIDHAAQPSIAARKAIKGVLDALVSIIAIEPQKPITPAGLALPVLHSHQNRGINATPNAPARMGWANAPCAPTEPSRTVGKMGTDPTYPKIFSLRNFSLIM